jgi:hypothetical protein
MRLPRHFEIWGPGYVRSRLVDFFSRPKPKRVWVTVCDHYEPLWRNVDLKTGDQRVALWRDLWPRLAEEVGPDSRGSLPKYSFFFPQDEYHPSFLDPLAELTQMGVADVEIHIHHDGDGRDAFIEKMATFRDVLHRRHGLLRKADGRLVFGFIHGNWTLDNSRPDGRWCGLNDELLILKDLGCYADFTMPSGPSPTQAAKVNRIYWATDDPAHPKSYNHGTDAVPGSDFRGDMLMITGPIGFRWRERLVPRTEIAELAHNDPANPRRVKRWFDLSPQIGQDLFIKLHTHGTQEKNSDLLLRRKHLVELYRLVSAEAKRRGAEVYFASAWEMYQGVMAAIEERQTDFDKTPSAVVDGSL